MSPVPAVGAAPGRTATRAVVVTFAVSGFALAAWLARIPAVRDSLGVSPGRLGLVLLALALGSTLALPLSGPVVHHLRPARTVALASILVTMALVGIGLGGSGALGGVRLLVPSLFFAGIGIGMWDVAMNVEGARVERVIGRDIMPWFHAAFSLGTVGGALTGALAAATGLALPVHLSIVAVLSAAAVLAAVRGFLPTVGDAGPDPDPDRNGDEDEPGAVARAGTGSGTLQAWREPRTLLIGLLVMGMALAEGSANDWLALGLVDGYGLGHAAGAVGLGLFLTAMTACRLAGPFLLSRFGRVLVVRASALLVLAGVLVYVGASRLVPTDGSGGDRVSMALAGVAILAWGCGAALGFPIGMSAAADDPERAAARVSVVATIGYVAFLAGPPVLGLLADHVGVVTAMLGVAAAVAASLLAASSAAAPDGVESRRA